MAGYKNKLWICAKCGRVFDGYETYDNLPTYGLKKHLKLYCHHCRKNAVKTAKKKLENAEKHA